MLRTRHAQITLGGSRVLLLTEAPNPPGHRLDIPRWILPAAISVTVPLPSYAVQYLTVSAAQKLCFPECDQFVPAHVKFTPAQIKAIEAKSGQKQLLRGQEIWRAMQTEKLHGFFIVDYVIGKHLVIDYAVALSPEGTVKRIEILNYRESYGGEKFAILIGESSSSAKDRARGSLSTKASTISVAQHFPAGM